MADNRSNQPEAEYIVIVFDAYAFGRCSNLLAKRSKLSKTNLMNIRFA